MVHESKMVGENMQDHVMIGCQARAQGELALDQPPLDRAQAGQGRSSNTA